MADRSSVVRRLIALAVATAALVLGPSATAQAHDSLESSAPAEGRTVATAPDAVTLVFGEAPQALGTQVVVTAPDGSSATDGEPTLSGATVTQRLADGLAAGTYTVAWRVTSADGHPVTGAYEFTVSARASGAGPRASTPDVDAVAPTGSSTSPWLWIGLGGIVAVAGSLLVRQFRRPA